MFVCIGLASVPGCEKATQKKAADVDGNSDVNAVDASYILEYYAYSSTVKDKPMTMTEFMADKKAKTK